MSENFYNVLGVNENATKEEIKKAEAASRAQKLLLGISGSSTSPVKEL
jgi:hypothetical protein